MTPHRDDFRLPISPEKRLIGVDSQCETTTEMTDPTEKIFVSVLEQLNFSLSVALDPDDLYRRAELYTVNGFPELAAADAYVGITLMDAVDDPEGDGDPDDLIPRFAGMGNTHQWPCHPPGSQERYNEIWTHRFAFLKLLVEALRELDCTSDADTYLTLLKSHCREIPYNPGDGIAIPYTIRPEETGAKSMRRLPYPPAIIGEEPQIRDQVNSGNKIIGRARRLIYPWNTHEPSRMSPENVRRINEELWKVAPKLEVKVVELPKLALDTGLAQEEGKEVQDGKQPPRDVQQPKETIRQLGLFAREALKPSDEVLCEKSFLTGQIESGMGICDGCTGPLSTESTNENFGCQGCSKIFCDEKCHDLALASFHGVPKSEFWSYLTHDGPPKSTERYTDRWPFCDNEAAGLEDIGRHNSGDREDQLYFQLVFRVVEMAERQNKHPLDLDEVRWLWGDFTDPVQHERSLPWSLKYNVIFPLQHFTTMMASHQSDWHDGDRHDENEKETENAHSDDDNLSSGSHTDKEGLNDDRTKNNDPGPTPITPSISHPNIPPPSRFQPYGLHWLARYDWWVVNTLYAKFRAVASARQSSWDGSPEAAGVHWRWCLANHSCNPNVGWVWAGVGSEGHSGGGSGPVDGYMRLIVRKAPVWVRPDGGETDKQGNLDEIGENNTQADGERNREEKWEGIKAGEEILSHYCDIELPLRERRLWAKASLGGVCMCERCRYEQKEEGTKGLENDVKHLGLSNR